MRILLAAVAATFLLIVGQAPASAATAGQALVQKPAYSFGHANAMVDKAGWRRRYWRRHYYRRRWYRWWW